MPRWRVDYIGKVLSTLGQVEAATERQAIAKAAEEFNIAPARRNKIAVTRLADRKHDHKEGPGRRLGWRPRPPTQVHPRWRAGIAQYSSRLFLLHFGG